jgi:hypothetical protein
MPGSAAHITSPAVCRCPGRWPARLAVAEPAAGVEGAGDDVSCGSVPDWGTLALREMTVSRRIAIWPAAQAHTAIQNDQTATGDGIWRKMYLPTVTG